MPVRPFSVVFVVYPDIVLLDLAGPLQVFAGARRRGEQELAYETAVASVDGGKVQTDTIVAIESLPMRQWFRRRIHTLVVVGGNGAVPALADRNFVGQVARLAARSQRVCSVCSGALILAAAGLLEGRRATTHWDDCAHLARLSSNVEVQPDPIYVKDGNVWTSAGITAGIDMSLAIVAEDLGREPALELAQSLVTYMVRPGGQSQFSPVLTRQMAETSGRFEGLHRWIEANLARELRVEDLAAHEHMSLRNFHRLYCSTMGITPAKAVEAIRMEAAREMLETTGSAIKAVARRCGFGDEERLRRAFVRSMGLSPSEYRRRFRLASR